MDWTGSSDQRRPQGGCRPPKVKPNQQARFEIPASTKVSVCRVSDSNKRWRKHVTRVQLGFERFESRKSSQYVFREQGWLIRVAVSKVRSMDR